MIYQRFLVLTLFVSAACTVEPITHADPPRDRVVAESIYIEQGPHPVGNRSVELYDAARSRTLRVELWYPAAESARAAAETGQPTEDFAYGDTDHTTLRDLLKAATMKNGPTKRTRSALNAPMASAEAQWPVAVFSHCYDCTRWSTFSIAERLASHGIAVAAPDHAGGTMFDHLRGDSESLGPDFLEVRAADVRFVLDQVLDANSQLPEEVRGRFDARRIGVFGHSFGGATTGRVLNLDARPKAGLALAVPFANPIFEAVEMAKIKVPVFYLLAQEDNSITEVGNDYIRDNFNVSNPPAWKAEVADAGHFSFTDICGIIEGYDAGCTYEDRQTSPGEYFEYIDIELGKAIAQAYVAAFFAHTLNADPKAGAFLDRAFHPEYVSVDSRH